jgi:putative MATE family efflux protein
MIILTDELARRQYEKMTLTPVHRLVLKLAVPTIISMLVTNIYNMADTYFVSGIGTSASGATGVVFGLMAIIQAFGFMFGHGSGSHISRKLGSREVDDARTYSATGFFLALMFGIVLLVLGNVFIIPLVRVLGSTDSILPYAKTYATFILIAAPAMTTSCVMNNILRYEGMAAYSMVGLASGGILNIFGDFVLIRVFGMGIEGAGISTAVAQYIGMGVLMLPFVTGRVQSSLNTKYISIKFNVLSDIISVGMPSMMRQGLNSVSVMVLNLCASPYGDAAIAAMSITSRIVNFMFCVSVGIGQGFQPVSAFNYGAKKYKRVKDACVFTCVCSVVLMVIASFFGVVFARDLITFFRDDIEVINIGTTALRFQSISMVLMPISLCGNMLFQSVGKGGLGTLMASIRSGLVFIPVLIVFSRFGGILGIQLAQPVSDALASAVTLPFIIDFFRKLPIEEDEK